MQCLYYTFKGKRKKTVCVSIGFSLCELIVQKSSLPRCYFLKLTLAKASHLWEHKTWWCTVTNSPLQEGWDANVIAVMQLLHLLHWPLSSSRWTLATGSWEPQSIHSSFLFLVALAMSRMFGRDAFHSGTNYDSLVEYTASTQVFFSSSK